jgi:peroxiredoxin
LTSYITKTTLYPTIKHISQLSQSSIPIIFNLTAHHSVLSEKKRNTKMSTSHPLPTNLPTNLPVPEDDGALNHLANTTLPPLSLPTTSSTTVDISALKGLTILFTYPRTGGPGEKIPESWDAIPGARGCSPQACSFRDALSVLLKKGVSQIYGLSTQDTEYQREAKERLHLSYDLLSDEGLEFVKAVGMPTFTWEGKDLVKRSILAIRDGKVVKVWYPVFPPDASASLVEEWLDSE